MQQRKDASLSGRHIVFFNWRDTANPEGGGSERYVEAMARGLVERGAEVTIFCAEHDQAPRDEVVSGVRFRRRGSKLGIYVQGLLHLFLRRFGRVDLVVDVQNGLPFFTRLATRRPVVVLVHHVHREQWPVVYPGLMGKVGWWIESWLAPLLYRSNQYVAVSQATRHELIQLGIDEHRIAVVHNGTEPAPPVTTPRSEHPLLCVVGRLVPHKQVEHAFDTVAALRSAHPDIRLAVVGDGWWAEPLRKAAADKGLLDVVTFEGHVSDERKHEVYAASWLMLLPSLKEGWGLVVGEAGSHGVPTVAYTSAGGTRESIVSGRTGLLVHDQKELTAAVEELLEHPEELRRLGDNARTFARNFAWENSQTSFATVVQAAAAGMRLDVEDPPEEGGSV